MGATCRGLLLPAELAQGCKAQASASWGGEEGARVGSAAPLALAEVLERHVVHEPWQIEPLGLLDVWQFVAIN